MARIRTIKPEFWQDEELAQCSAHSRLLAIALLQLADVKGRLRWVSMQIHAHAFPFEPDLDINALGNELVSAGYLVRYVVNGREYAEIPGFVKHQRLSGKESYSDSKIPDPSPGSEGEKHSDSRVFQERERERERERILPRDKSREDLRKKAKEEFHSEFWPKYPRKKNKGDAEKAWLSLTDEQRAKALTALPAAKACRDWQKDNGQFIPYPGTWLRAHGFDDEHTPTTMGASTGELPYGYGAI